VSRRWEFFLADMIDAARELIARRASVTREALDHDVSVLDTFMMRFLILGEAAKKIPAEVRARYPQVDWRGMAGLRDVIAHSYYRVNPNILWDAAGNILPATLPILEEIAREHPLPDDGDFD
jgi:uncharacterized protein with HEPN domain